MSKLLSMLSKLNRPPVNGAVLPDVRVNVARDGEASRQRRKLLLYGAVCGGAVLLGIGVRLSLDGRVGPAPHPTPPPAVVRQMPLPAGKGGETAEPAPVTVEASTVQSTPAPPRRTGIPRGARSRLPGSEGVNTPPEVPLTSPRVTTPPPTPATSSLPAVDKEARDSLVVVARSAERRKAYAEALRLYQKALIHDPENHGLMNNAASVRIRLGEYAAASALCDRALHLSPDYLPALVNQGIARSALGDSAGASSSFARAIELDPANREALYNLALFNEKNGRIEAAAEVFGRLAASGDVAGMMGVARLDEKRSRTDAAVKIYADVAAMHDIPAEVRNLAMERLRQLRNR